MLTRSLFVVLALCALATTASAQSIAKDEPFPSLTLPAAKDGRAMSVNDYRGQKLILHIFASW